MELKRGNTLIFEEFYLKYQPLIYKIAYSIVRHKEDSEEIVQMVFFKIYEMDSHKLPSKKEASWLYTLTRNETVSYLRKKNHVVEVSRLYEWNEDEQELNDRIGKIEFYQLIRTLNEKEKQIVTLKIVGELSFQEIGKLLNEPTSTVKWRYYKSIHTLKLLLGNLGMFVMLFVVGLKLLLHQNHLSNRQPSQIIEDETIKQDKEENENKTETLEDEKKTTDQKQEISNEPLESEIRQEMGIPIKEKDHYGTYFGIGVLGISGIFFIMTILFSLFLVKYQLKGKVKTSK